MQRDVRDLERGRPAGLRRGRPPRRALERPARRPRPGADVRDQRARQRAPRPGGARGRRRPLRLRLVLLDVRRLRRGPRRPRKRRCSRSRPTPSRRCAPRRGSPSSPTTISRRSSCAARRPTASRRAYGWTSCSTTSSAGRSPPGRSASSATARPGGRSSTSRTSRAPPPRCSPRRARSSTRSAFNVGAPTRELPGARPCRDRPGDGARLARPSTAAAPIPTRAATASTSASSSGRCPS